MARARTLIAVLVSCCARIASAQIAEHDARPQSALLIQGFDVRYACEVTVVLRAACMGCSWAAEGWEAAALRISVDGKYSQHLLLSRGGETADYRVSLGGFGPGHYAFRIDLDPAASAAHVESVAVSLGTIEELFEKSPSSSSPSQIETPDFTALSRAPILYARANT